MSSRHRRLLRDILHCDCKCSDDKYIDVIHAAAGHVVCADFNMLGWQTQGGKPKVIVLERQTQRWPVYGGRPEVADSDLFHCCVMPGICMSLCQQLCIKTTERSFMKILPQIYLWTGKNGLNFGRHPLPDPDPGIVKRVLQHCEMEHFFTVWLISLNSLIASSGKCYHKCNSEQGSPC